VTAETARTCGFEVVVSSGEYTVDALLDAIVSYFHQ
jgi:uroporphyrinogen-III synthase